MLGEQMTSIIKRKVYALGDVTDAAEETVICRYLPMWKFKSLIETGGLYLSRLNEFKDQLEGRAPQAVWEISGDNMKQWFATNREHFFVCCWHINDAETPDMWKEYAEGRGVMIRSTVGRLRVELSTPAPEPGLPHDGFTIGVVEYLDQDKIKAYEGMAAGLSNTTPMFRKAPGYIKEAEYRMILRSGAASEEIAWRERKTGVVVPVDLSRLIQEIRFSPPSDAALRSEVEALLPGTPLLDRLVPSTL
jgi:hypothetical protein